MNTQTRTHRLEAGQAGRGAAGAVLAEGELLVQQRAQWLAGTVVVPAAVRLVAPAQLPPASCSFVALRASTVVVPQAAPLLSAARVAGWLRDALGRHPAAALREPHAR